MSYGLEQGEMREIMNKKKENLHQVACLRLFEASHKGSVAENVGNHPNAFFNSSLAYHKEVEKKNKPNASAAAPTSAEKNDVEMK